MLSQHLAAPSRPYRPEESSCGRLVCAGLGSEGSVDAPPFGKPDLHTTHTGALLSFSASAITIRSKPMLIVHVHVHVKPESVEAFKQASLENARASVKEPGIAAFDVVQQQDDPTRFVLVEAYRTPDAPAAHKETSHYQKWRDAVAPMMAEPRSSVKYTNLFPEDKNW
jgi:quinol monooxygenase YgiN